MSPSTVKLHTVFNTSRTKCAGCQTYGHKQMHVLGFSDCVVKLCPKCWRELCDMICGFK